MNANQNLPVVGFLGDKGSLFRECERIFATWAKTHPVKLIAIDPLDFSLQTLKENNVEALIVDMKHDSDNFDRVFNEVKYSYFPGKLYVVASVFNLTALGIERAQKLGFAFIYQYSGQVVEESKFLAETTLNCIYRSNIIRHPFAVARVDQETAVQAPVYLKQLCLKEFVISSNLKLNEKIISSFKHDYLKKLNWRDSGLNIIKTESSSNGLFNWNMVVRSELIKPAELDRFEVEFSQEFPAKVEDRNFKKEQLEKFLAPILIEKKQNMSAFYRKNRFNCEAQNKKNIILFTKNNLNFRFKKEEIINNFNVYKKSKVNPTIGLIKKIKPAVIFYELEVVPEGISEKNALHLYNDVTSLRMLFQKLQENGLQIPLIVFNPGLVLSSELIGMAGIRDLFQEVNSKFCANFVHDFLKEKIPEPAPGSKNQLNFNAAKVPEPVIHADDKDYSDFGLLEFTAKIESLTENEMIFQANAELPEFTIFKVPQQFGLYFTIIPNEKVSQQNTPTTKRYHAIINGLAAEERDVLRGFVINFNKKNVA